MSDAEAPGDGFADQRARTSLAWSRTSLGAVVAALLVTRLAWVHGRPTLWLVLPAAFGAIVAVVALVRTRALASSRAYVPGSAARTVAAMIALLAVVAAVLVLSR